METLQANYAAQGLEVLGFLSNDFGNQAGSSGQIDACNEQFGVTFDQYAIDHVTGAMARPVYKWLFAQTNPGPATSVEPEWNFHKYLIGRDGSLVAHWDSPTEPDSPAVIATIEAELAKPAP